MADYTTALEGAGQKLEFHQLVSNTTVDFKAFVTQFEDQYVSEWNEETVFGRMDPIATFKRTGRKISLGWDIPSYSSQDAVQIMNKISILTRMLYPSYELSAHPSSTHISGPPLMRIKFMNLMQTSFGEFVGQGLLGFVKGFTVSPIFESGFIDGTPAGDGAVGLIYPRGYKMACEFTVLHTHKLGWYGLDETPPASDTDTADETETPAASSRFANNEHGNEYPYGVTRDTEVNVAAPSDDLTAAASASDDVDTEAAREISEAEAQAMLEAMNLPTGVDDNSAEADAWRTWAAGMDSR